MMVAYLLLLKLPRFGLNVLVGLLLKSNTQLLATEEGKKIEKLPLHPRRPGMIGVAFGFADECKVTKFY